MQKLNLAIMAALILTACATNGSTRSERIAETLSDPRVGEEVDRVCFTRGIDAFSENKEDSVVLRRAVNDEYLVITRSCPDLEWAQSLALINRSTSCLSQFDEIRVFRSAFGPSQADLPGGFRCQIDEIYRWDDSAIAEDESAETEEAEAN